MRLVKKGGSLLCCEYIILYIDNTMVVGESADNILMNDMGRYFELKDESIAPSPIYLGGRVHKVDLDTEGQCWAFSSS